MLDVYKRQVCEGSEPVCLFMAADPFCVFSYIITFYPGVLGTKRFAAGSHAFPVLCALSLLRLGFASLEGPCYGIGVLRRTTEHWC